MEEEKEKRVGVMESTGGRGTDFGLWGFREGLSEALTLMLSKIHKTKSGWGGSSRQKEQYVQNLQYVQEIEKALVAVKRRERETPQYA